MISSASLTRIFDGLTDKILAAWWIRRAYYVKLTDAGPNPFLAHCFLPAVLSQRIDDVRASQTQRSPKTTPFQAFV